MSMPMTYERPTLAETIGDIGVRKVRVEATVVFDAFVLEDHDDRAWSLETRVEQEIADAVTYRAPHLTDTEPGDALIVLDFEANVSANVYPLTDAVDVDSVAERADGYAGEVFG